MEPTRQAILDSIASNISISVDSHLVFVNRAFVALHGLDAATQAIGARSDAFVLGSDKYLLKVLVVAQQQDETLELNQEFRIVRPDGSVRCVESTSTLTTYNGAPATLTSMTDITVRKAEQLELAREADDRALRVTELNALVKIATILSGPGSTRENSRQVLEVLIEFIGADRAVLRHPDGHGALLTYAAAGQTLMQAHPPAFSTEISDLGVSGQAFTLGRSIVENNHKPGGRTHRVISDRGMRASVGLPIFGGEKTIAVLQVGSKQSGFFTDPMVSLLDAIGKSLGVLLHNAHLRESLEHERSMHERKDDFIAIASHELRTPMTMMMGFTELLLDGEPDAELRKSWYEAIHSQTKRLTGIIDQMLDASNIQAGVIAVDSSPVSLDTIVDRIVDRYSAESPTHRFVIEPRQDLPQVMGDSDRLDQVLVNLIDNAVKFSPEGGNILVSLEHDRSEGTVVVAVTDEGIGMSPADQMRLFEPFERGDRAETDCIAGPGLGLYVARSLVELMGGYIRVRSEDSGGTTFSIGIPVAKSPAESERVYVD
ncbi:MAG: ATP-binding protein [Chloroflexi bacterium]|nr:ATP-binding protein [Chloroflexota bacterium]